MESPTSLTQCLAPERARPKRVRRVVRPADKLEQLRSTVAALERALPVVLTLDDPDEVEWAGFLDPTALRLRRRMRETLQLTKQAQELVSSQRQLQRLLREHRMASRVLAGLVLRATPEDLWQGSTEKWHVIARRHFEAWTLADCQEEMQAALREMNAFQWRTDKQTTGASFLGWRDSRHVDPARFQLQFEFYKTFHGQDYKTYVAQTWEAYTTASLFQEIIVGPRARSSHVVLQRLGPNIAMVMSSERSPAVTVDVHMLFLVFLIQTEDVVTLCVRSITSPELMKAIDTPSDVWGAIFFWAQWEPHREKATQAFDFRLGGTIGGVDVTFATQWMSEVFGSLLRTERRATGRGLLTSE